MTMVPESVFPHELRLRTYERITETLELEKALQGVLLTLKSVLPADGVFVNYFRPEDSSVQFMAKADAKSAEKYTECVPVPYTWREQMTYEKRGTCLVASRPEDDPPTQYVLSRTIPKARSWIMLRLLLSGTHFGVVCFYSDKLAAFNERHAEIVSALHNPLALAVGYALAMWFRSAGLRLNEENRRLQSTISAGSEAPLEALLKRTPSLVHIAPQIRRVAPYNATVMLTGESGCGKDVVAGVIQRLSGRRDAPFVRVNCAALPPNLIESELFGYEKGAFTGAASRHPGLFEQADGGTLFLDEVGELPLAAQAKLLRVLQGQGFRRVGGDKDVNTDVRIICATNRDLEAMVAAKTFREDLYWRLNVFPIRIAPLRERLEDIEPLAAYFMSSISRRYGLPMAPRLSQEAIAQAKAWTWPGNVRELRNVMERAVLSGESIVRHLDLRSEGEGVRDGLSVAQLAARDAFKKEGSSEEAKKNERAVSLGTFDECQRAYFRALLKSTRGKISGTGGAAEKAGMHPNTLRSRLLKLGLYNPRADRFS
jgi:transcriptional regulator with GAF, ATPase, and Fis domain